MCCRVVNLATHARKRVAYTEHRMPNARLLILDANALIHRAYHALPPLTSPSGEPVGALYGLCLTLLNVLKTFKPTHVVAAFDRPGKTFRHEQFEAYKAQRVKAPEELIAQIVRAKDVLGAFAVPTLDAEGYEADDVIGTVTARAAKDGIESVIVTGDQDALQLVDGLTKVHLLRRGLKDTVTLGTAEVRDRYGLTPGQLVDYKALRGDPSDNIPGVRGIGEKTATALLQKFKTLAGVYQNRANIPDAIWKKLEAGKKDALVSRALVTIVRNVPLPVEPKNLARSAYDRQRVVALFREYGFASLLPRLLSQGEDVRGQARKETPATQGTLTMPHRAPSSQKRTKEYRLLRSAEAVSALAKKLSASRGFVVDTETERLGARTNALHGVSVALEEGRAFYVPAQFVPLLKPALERADIPKFGHNLKYDLEVFRRVEIALHPVSFDTMLASYVLAPGTRAHDLDTLSFTLLGREKIPITALIGKGKDQRAMSKVPLEDVAEYSCEDADMTLRLVHYFTKAFEGEPRLRSVFTEIEAPLVPALAHMELAGVKLDKQVLTRMRTGVGRSLRVLAAKIIVLAGEPFNINSPVQLREILFSKLRLPTVGIGRTQSGLSTAAEELEKLRAAHPIIPALLEYRELAKLKSTYLDALPALIDAETGRVYTSYNQTIAATGRLSSSEPNLQNIPVRTDLGARIRTAFIAEPGNVLVAADYSQLELRLAAHIAQDRAMQAVFRRGGDIHTETAAIAFHVAPEQVTKAQRRQAKTLNFGVLYGMGAQAFARAADISLSEAQRFIAEYFQTYRGIAEYMEEAKAAAAAVGYVETLAGRRRYLPEIASRNPQVRGEAERMAINHPIQGTAADILKKSMIAIYARMAAGTHPFSGVQMTLTVHDELVFEVPRGQADAVGRAVQTIMEGVEHLSVPLVVDVRSGKNWGELRVHLTRGESSH